MSPRPSRERRPQQAPTPEAIARVDELVASAPPLSQQHVGRLRTIFRSAREQQQRLATAGICRWNACGQPMAGWALEETEGSVPVYAGCVAEHDLTLVTPPV